MGLLSLKLEEVGSNYEETFGHSSGYGLSHYLLGFFHPHLTVFARASKSKSGSSSQQRENSSFPDWELVKMSSIRRSYVRWLLCAVLAKLSNVFESKALCISQALQSFYGSLLHESQMSPNSLWNIHSQFLRMRKLVNFLMMRLDSAENNFLSIRLEEILLSVERPLSLPLWLWHDS